ncbi:MAG: hypothetical protein ACKVZ0_00075 [Gemmatimonadales bacterium]
MFKQTKVISSIRNSLAHYGSFEEGYRKRVTSNVSKALTVDKTTVYRVSPRVLGEMTEDVVKIAVHLLSLTVMPDFPLDVRAARYPALKTVWKYRPSDEPLGRSRSSGRKKPT